MLTVLTGWGNRNADAVSYRRPIMFGKFWIIEKYTITSEKTVICLLFMTKSRIFASYAQFWHRNALSCIRLLYLIRISSTVRLHTLQPWHRFLTWKSTSFFILFCVRYLKKFWFSKYYISRSLKKLKPTSMQELNYFSLCNIHSHWC